MLRVVIHNVFFVEEVIMIPRYMCGFGEISVNDSNCRFFRFLMCHFVPLTVSQYLVYCEHHFLAGFTTRCNFQKFQLKMHGCDWPSSVIRKSSHTFFSD